jgi:hypothetical protein
MISRLFSTVSCLKPDRFDYDFTPFFHGFLHPVPKIVGAVAWGDVRPNMRI